MGPKRSASLEPQRHRALFNAPTVMEETLEECKVMETVLPTCPVRVGGTVVAAVRRVAGSVSTLGGRQAGGATLLLSGT